MKTFLVLALLAAGFSIGSNAEANEFVPLYCSGNGIASNGSLKMERISEYRFTISDETVNEQGKITRLVTTYLYGLDMSKTQTGNTNITGNAERQISPDGFAQFGFKMHLSKNQSHASVTVLSKENKVIDTYNFSCWNPDNR
jgi:hypothetical protein